MVHFHIGTEKSTEQKAPGSSLMVSGVPLCKSTAVNAMVVRMIRCEGAKSAADKQLFFHKRDNCFFLFLREQGKWKGYGVNLVWTDMVVRLVTIHNIKQTLVGGIPELGIEGFFYLIRRVCGRQKHLRQIFRRVIP